jgi:hypothetical protein
MYVRSLFVFAMSLAVCFISAFQLKAAEKSAAEKILENSTWSFVIDGMQKGGMRIVDGQIYPGSVKLNNVAGEASFTETGELSLKFVNHPKITAGESLVTKVAKGEWSGTLVQPSGERLLELTKIR